MSLSLIKQISDDLDRLDNKVTGFADRFGQLQSTIGSQVERVAAVVEEATQNTEEQVEALFGRVDVQLEKLLGAMDQLAESPQREALEQALLSLGEGNATLDELNRTYGQVVVNIDGLDTKLSQVLARMDPRRAQESIQELRRLIEQEVFGIDEILAVLDRSVDGWSKRLADFVRAAQESKISLEDLLREADKVFDARGADTFAGAAAEGLADLLRRGTVDI